MKRTFVLMIALAVSACHSSCSEETGAEPVATAEAGTVEAVSVGQQRPLPIMRPNMRPIHALTNNQSTSATPPPADEN